MKRGLYFLSICPRDIQGKKTTLYYRALYIEAYIYHLPFQVDKVDILLLLLLWGLLLLLLRVFGW